MGLIINCGEIRNLHENPRNSQLKHVSVGAELQRESVHLPWQTGEDIQEELMTKPGKVTADLTFLN